jgi:hypothetical protein
VSDPAVHVAPSVAAVRALWDRSGLHAGPDIRDQLIRFAQALVDADVAGELAAAVLISNWSDGGEGARGIVARDHGFATWASVQGECDPTFERAVEAVVHGRIDELRELLADHPDFSVRRSAYGHRATLLHYTAANGVEIRRQLVPANAAEVVAALLDAGADRAATLHAYGGDFDVMAMLETSAHPHDAGVAAEIERALAMGRTREERRRPC